MPKGINNKGKGETNVSRRVSNRRVQRRRHRGSKKVLRQITSATTSSPSSSPFHALPSTPTSPYDAAISNNQLRTMRKEKRDLIQQLAEAERRAKILERKTTQLEDRAINAENAKDAADQERDDALAAAADQSALYDEGTELWQNVWEKVDVSAALTFPTNKSALCQSVKNQGGNHMPGVHAIGAIDNGRTTQSIWLKGSGYGLVGLVTNDEEKYALRHRVGHDFTKVPYMTATHMSCTETQGVVYTIEVDMIERRAELYISSKESIGMVEPHTVWENLPDTVWVAVAFKRNSGREAVLMPCLHHNMKEISQN